MDAQLSQRWAGDIYSTKTIWGTAHKLFVKMPQRVSIDICIEMILNIKFFLTVWDYVYCLKIFWSWFMCLKLIAFWGEWVNDFGDGM